MTRAKLVGPAPETNRGSYWWISSEEVLLMRPAHNPRRFKLLRLDVSTGREAALVAFNRKHGARIIGQKWQVSTHGVPGFEIEYWTPQCALSPDGKWFLWVSGGQTWIVASLDGAMQREWAEQNSIPSSYCWLPDSERWVQLVSQYRRECYTLRKAIVRTAVRRSASKATEIQVADGLVIGVTDRGCILIYHSRREEVSTEASLSEVSLVPGQPTRRRLIRLPEPGHIWGASLSKAGDRLAWIVSVGEQVFPREYVFWVSGLDGKKFEEVGRMKGQCELPATNSSQTAYYWPQSLRWLPDGDEVSYIFKEDIYRLRIS